MTRNSPRHDHRDELLGAAKDKDFARVGTLLETLQPSDLRDRRVGEAFVRAAIADEVKVVTHFVEKGIDVNLTVNESTALGASSLRANLSTVRFLLQSGADVNQRSKEDDTPLIAVCRGAAIAQQFKCFEDHDKTASILLKNSADPNAQNISAMCALHYAIQAGATRLCRMLLKAGADVSLRDIAGGTVLEYAAVSGDLEIARLLLKRGASVNVKNALGVSPLYTAAVLNRLDIARLFLDAGADPNAQDQDGATATDAARREGHNEIIRLLDDWQRSSSRRKRGRGSFH
jgi:ankyrin repeat protein